MTVGIIGAGGIGQAFAMQLARAGIKTLISNKRGPETLTKIVKDIGYTVTAVTTREAAQADIVMVAVPWNHILEALSNLPSWDGCIIIDPTNPLFPPDFKHANLWGRTSSEVVSDLVPGAWLVKAFNTHSPAILAANPQEAGGKRVIFFSGDDQFTKAEIARLIDRLGFAGLDLGNLVGGGKLQQFPGGPLPILNLIKLP